MTIAARLRRRFRRHSRRLATLSAIGIPLAALAQVLPGCAQRMSTDSPTTYRFGSPEVVAAFPDMMPTGVTVSHGGRLFVNFPRWGDDVPFTVAEVIDGEPVPYPSAEFNTPDLAQPSERLLSVQSLVVDQRNNLWLLDTGSPNFEPTIPGGPKLVRVNLDTNRVDKKIVLPRDVALETTYLNDVRFDYTRGDDGLAYITDSSFTGPNAIIVVDLATGAAWRKLDDHPSVRPDEDFIGWIEGRPWMNRPADGEAAPTTVGADGLAIDVLNDRLWYCALSSRELFSVSLDALADRYRPDAAVAQTVRRLGDRGFASDGLESDAQGRLYLTNIEDNAVVRLETDGSYVTLTTDPRLLWPDTLDLARDRALYFTTNQLHRQPGFQGGTDQRRPPYYVWRLPVRATPATLGN